MKEWDLMKALAQANNQGDQSALSALILEHDFDNKPQALTMAVSCFQLTEDNVKKHRDAANKLANEPEPAAFREGFRQSMLIEMLKTFGDKTENA